MGVNFLCTPEEIYRRQNFFHLGEPTWGPSIGGISRPLVTFATRSDGRRHAAFEPDESDYVYIYSAFPRFGADGNVIRENSFRLGCEA